MKNCNGLELLNDSHKFDHNDGAESKTISADISNVVQSNAMLTDDKIRPTIPFNTSAVKNVATKIAIS